MSDVVRNYARPGRKRPRKRQRKSGIPKFLFLMILLIGAAVLWLTRDSYSMHTLIPAGQAYEVFVAEPLEKRVEIAQSKIWDALPASWEAEAVHETIRGEYGLPPWVLNNLVYGACHVSGDSLAQWKACLFVTKMSRTGCLLERALRFRPAVKADYAGGLRLYYYEKEQLYYAVRGRILVASPNRNAVINALTLTQQDQLSAQALEDGFAAIKEDDFFMRYREPEHAVTARFEEGAISVQAEPGFVNIRGQGTLAEALKQRLLPGWTELTPKELRCIDGGLVTMSLNLGGNADELLSNLGVKITDWELPEPFVQSSADQLKQVLGPMLAGIGPGMRLNWQGFDLNAMLPLPQLLVHGDTDPAQMAAAWELMGNAADVQTTGIDLGIYRDAEAPVAFMPLMGGRDMEPSLVLDEKFVCFSTSGTQTRSWLESPLKLKKLAQQGNIFISLQPSDALKALVEAGKSFESWGALPLPGQKSVGAVFAPWVKYAAPFSHISMLISFDRGTATMDLMLRFS